MTRHFMNFTNSRVDGHYSPDNTKTCNIRAKNRRYGARNLFLP